MIALLRTYLAPYKRALALVVGLLVVQALATLYLPALNGDIINNGVAKGDTTYILQTGMLMLAISGVVVVASIIAVYWGSKTGMSFGRDVRSSIFRKVESFSRAELDTFGTASLITRNTNDVQQVQMVVLLGLNMMIIAPDPRGRRDHPGAPSGRAAVGDPDRRPADHGHHRRHPDVPGRCPCSRRCR